jgi:hypothetical protein
MNVKQKNFPHVLIFALALLSVGMVVLIGALGQFRRNKTEVNIVKEETIQTEESYINSSSDLTVVYEMLVSSGDINECHYFDNCFNKILSPEDKYKIANKYQVVENMTGSPEDIKIGLLKGLSIDVTGIGTGYLNNKEYLNNKDDSWYWEVGACSTNNRIFIDAVSGKAGPLHQYVYCGGVF